MPQTRPENLPTREASPIARDIAEAITRAMGEMRGLRKVRGETAARRVRVRGPLRRRFLRRAADRRRDAPGPHPRAAILMARPRPSRIHLASLAEVRREIAALYRSAKGGAIEAQTAAKLGSLLALLLRALEIEKVETKLAEIERALAEHRPAGDPWGELAATVAAEAAELRH